MEEELSQTTTLRMQLRDKRCDKSRLAVELFRFVLSPRGNTRRTSSLIQNPIQQTKAHLKYLQKDSLRLDNIHQAGK